ncbi:amidohydrolase family protein [Roseiconus nitratireducens]|uniref:Amidohydrolase family protein n=1 Tax=Roseiconus nitratireducens TaxID=2605748 RepID=A0A5M6DIZ3_9BACT|nr:amidohydrolase family protein [Roseiconus nitratireducens]KAA5545235.1 amidohydrolase family protein [Roseiconus nitratireducens]
MLIDSHHHLWKYSADQYGWINDDMQRLKQDYWADQLRELAVANGVDGFVTVQARQSLVETDTLLALAESLPLIRGVVGWLDLRREDIGDQLDRYADRPRLKGVRHVVQDEPQDDFILGTEFNRGVAQLAGRGLVYDILVFPRQLESAIQFAGNHPEIPMVLDHLAKPAVGSTAPDADWCDRIRKLAAHSHVACKFSGLATEVTIDRWDVATIRPYWDVVLDAFSPSRLMFGSDWPVCLLKTEYSRWLEAVRELAGELSPDEQSELFSGTAQRIYHLE